MLTKFVVIISPHLHTSHYRVTHLRPRKYYMSVILQFKTEGSGGGCISLCVDIQESARNIIGKNTFRAINVPPFILFKREKERERRKRDNTHGLAFYTFTVSGRTRGKLGTMEACGVSVVSEEWEKDTLLLPFVPF